MLDEIATRINRMLMLLRHFRPIPTVSKFGYLANFIHPVELLAANFSTRTMAETKTKNGKFKNPLVWIDLEMTGLEVETDKILELACILSDGELNNVKEGPGLIIHQSGEVLDNMNEWCTEQHGKTGLTDSCRKSTVTEEQAEKLVIDFLEENGIQPGQAHLAGNTVYMDRLFLAKYMPKIDKYLHYRIVDVSSVKELCRYWYPREYNQAPSKGYNHRAMEDIYSSIQELKYYREKIFV